MPINILNGLPAKEILESEKIFALEEDVARKQDIRPLRIAILNLMPKKIETETQIDHFRHGITCVQGYGGFSHKKIYILHTVVSTYEVADIIELLKQTDERIIVNVMRTEQFFGNFYQKPFE